MALSAKMPTKPVGKLGIKEVAVVSTSPRAGRLPTLLTTRRHIDLVRTSSSICHAS
ncbi:putative leader peptide [Streptomyces sp. NPDC031705]|uniref:putative leader peptide n=1 Tax=Streptomyces sp. NPDC031705 TaxID=3155729 RepID=UPI00340726EA